MSTRTSEHELRSAVLELLPPQGSWNEDEYLWLTDHTTRLFELTDGFIEPLPMPTDEHQGISGFLYLALTLYLQSRGGVVRYSPRRLRLRHRKFRAPDLLVLRDARDPRRENRYWHGADVVVEIVGPDKPERDLVEKRRDYAEAGIPEYRIVNPLNATIGVLTLHEGDYHEHGSFGRGERAVSALLPGFAVAVDEVFSSR